MGLSVPGAVATGALRQPSRLRRSMCGKAPLFRRAQKKNCGYAATRGRASNATQSTRSNPWAVSTGGDPMAFAGCAGGQLTARELDKCTRGFGTRDGCFGPNNEVVKGMREMGAVFAGQFGPNNDIVRNWNNAVSDLTHGPGPNNDVVRTVTNIGNEAPRAANNVGREIRKVLPSVRLW